MVFAASQLFAQGLPPLERPDALPVVEGSFEGGLTGWTVEGSVQHGAGGYHGSRCAVLTGNSRTRLLQELEVAHLQGSLPPGTDLEAGAWVHLRQPPVLSPVEQPSIFVELRLVGLAPGVRDERTLALGRWYPTLQDGDHWVYLRANSLALLPDRWTRLRVEVRRSFSAEVDVDFVQVGEDHAIDGNPVKRVGCSYVGRYRAPQFAPGPQPATAAERWRNWHWQVPPACGPAFTGFFHSPDCEGNPDCRREGRRRDAAASPLQNIDDLPLVGAYDSRDPAILRYHVRLAEAAGIDHFIYDYQGQAIAQQELSQGREPINAQTLEALITVCEAPAVQLKLAVMYEPKVHMLGWVLGQPTKAQKVAGITSDLIWLVQRMDGSRATLQSDGRLVVFLFRNAHCDPTGTQCLTDVDWAQIHGDVLAQTGEDLLLVGDTAPGVGSPIEGLSRWQLLQRDYLTYRTWSDARDGSPTWPAPQLAALDQHVRALDQSIRSWVAQAPQLRRGILTLWPGFDDSGVGGWGQENLLGEDGAPLCVRIADPLDGAFYSTTVAAAFDGGYDWVQIATWNDWNEATRIEPAWHPDYRDPLPLGQSYSPAITEQVFGRLIETRQWIEAFKGTPSSGPSFRSIARDYFSFAWQSATSPLYD